MFTGIVEELGEVVGKEDLADAARFAIRGPLVTTDAGHGDSIAVNGVCLTVVEVLPDGAFTADVMAETLNRSSLRRRRGRQPGQPRTRSGDQQPARWPHRAGPRRRHRPRHRPHAVRALGGGADRAAAALARYVVEKGSITVDGVSLTVSGLGQDWFEVSLIPTTLSLTTLGRAEVGHARQPRGGRHRQVRRAAARAEERIRRSARCLTSRRFDAHSSSATMDPMTYSFDDTRLHDPELPRLRE